MNRSFFARDTLLVAEQLIGCRLVRNVPAYNSRIIVQINETEAYKGSEDAASHAYRGITPRNQVMFATPGLLYVYFTYGMHFCMNIVCETDGVAGAVLLRGAVAIEGLSTIRDLRGGRDKLSDKQLLNGPAKLTQALAIDLNFNRYDLCDTSPSAPLIILPADELAPPAQIKRTSRIGIRHATDFMWRFVAE